MMRLESILENWGFARGRQFEVEVVLLSDDEEEGLLSIG